MKKTIAIILSILLVLAITLPAAAISTIAVKSITLKSSKITLKVGETANLVVTFTPANTSQKKLTYVTHDKYVATVSSTGQIKGVHPGTTTITVYTPNKKVFAKCSVTIPNPFAKNLQISLAIWSGSNCGNDQYYKDLSKKFNVDIKFINQDWSDYGQKVNIWAASGDMPDYTICALPSPDYFKLANQGILKALPSDLSQYPNMKNYIVKNDSIMKFFKIDGKLYVIPRGTASEFGTSITGFKFFVRKDWMEKYGIKDPKTYEELLKICQTFVDKNASDGNKTIGLTNMSVEYFYREFAMGMIDNPTWEKVDGKVVPGMLSTRNVEVLKLLRKYYQSDAIDRDFALNKNDMGMNKFVTGQAGLIYAGYGPLDMYVMFNAFEKANPGKKAIDCIKLLDRPLDSKGRMLVEDASGNFGTGSYLSAKSDDEKIDRILRMMDYALSAEGLKFGHMGAEGRDYKIQNGKFVSLIPKDEKTGAQPTWIEKNPTQILRVLVTWVGDYMNIDPSIPQEYRDMSKAYTDKIASKGVFHKRYFEIEFADIPELTKWNYAPEFYDGVAQIVVDTKDIDKSFKELVDKLLANGGNEAIKAVTEKFKDLVK